MTTRNNSGTYALVIYLPRTQTIRIGALGEHKFSRGYYMYIGSAMNGLAARIARHLVHNRLANRSHNERDQRAVSRWRERKKKMHWHIDYLLEHARVTEVMTHQGTERFECLWAQAALALPKTKVVVPRFGASDCKCATHLIYFGRRPPEEMKDEG
ncbi:MAG: GIY-YIG nuclease family protein [Chloroflexi bacterium]|nr:GIY-YIG nuclease family protein [Chloroflexota bacterium]